jgi:GNAT superfamily N-acetyltransferase
MWWRLTRAQFTRQTGEGNKQALKAIVDSGEVPGLLAYAGGEPIAWCSIGPRETFPVLDRSRTLKRVDDRPVWSIVCFFVAKPLRRQGVMERLLGAAIEYARNEGARTIEAYPVDTSEKPLLRYDGCTGVLSTFLRAGFVGVLRRSEHQPIMRYFIS